MASSGVTEKLEANTGVRVGVAYGAKDNVSTEKAFILDPVTGIPLRESWAEKAAS